MKTLVTFLKISFLCVINIIIWQQSIFSTVRPDEITTVTLPSIETGIIPEDIIYIEEFNRF
ncbi:MAG TPA: hypothetical protein PLR01_00705, partial [Bacteroidales bacterium]|nr:hypothetical protein [Bacteroidales bacterium]